MAKIDIGKLIDIASVVKDALNVEAKKDSNSLKPAEVTKVADPVATKVEAKVTQIVTKELQAREDFATDQEPFYLSRQWWVTMLGLAGSVAGLAGYAFPAEMQQQVLAIAMAGIGVITSVTLFYNRYVAKKPIGQ